MINKLRLLSGMDWGVQDVELGQLLSFHISVIFHLFLEYFIIKTNI